jgi:hypothetical protein
MAISRRDFVKSAGATTFALVSADGLRAFPFPVSQTLNGYRPELLPSEKELWAHQVWMAKLGPKFTGNPAHHTYVDFLEKNLKSYGLEVTRDNYKFPRWDVGERGIRVTAKSGQPFDVPVLSYYPYSGKTGPEGVTGELVSMEFTPSDTAAAEFSPTDVRGKVVYIRCTAKPPAFDQRLKVWGRYLPDTSFPTAPNVTWAGASIPPLAPLKKAGAVAVVMSWENISDAQGQDLYHPFGRAFQDFPAMFVRQESGKQLQALCGTGATVTVRLEATIYPDNPTDTLVATLPGMTSDEVVIVNSHTDGPNAIEENGPLGILGIAKYFSKLPVSARKRTLVFPLTTGHFAGAYVPSIRGFIQAHPELVKKAVASITVEHLGNLEWADDATGKWAPTGRNEQNFAWTDYQSIANVMLAGAEGTTDRRVAVATGMFAGEGNALNREGVPTIGYIAVSTYMLSGPPKGHVEKLSAPILHGQVESFVKVVHQMETMSAAELRGSGAGWKG